MEIESLFTYAIIGIIIGIVIFIVGSIIKKSILKLFSVMIILVAAWLLLSEFFDML